MCVAKKLLRYPMVIRSKLFQYPNPNRHFYLNPLISISLLMEMSIPQLALGKFGSFEMVNGLYLQTDSMKRTASGWHLKGMAFMSCNDPSLPFYRIPTGMVSRTFKKTIERGIRYPLHLAIKQKRYQDNGLARYHEHVKLSEGLRWYAKGMIEIPSSIKTASITIKLKPSTGIHSQIT